MGNIRTFPGDPPPPDQQTEADRQRAEIMRIMQEEQRVDAEVVRRALDVAMREAEHARVLAEGLRVHNETLRVAAEHDRQALVVAAQERGDAIAALADIENVLKQQGKMLIEIQNAIRTMTETRDFDYKA